MAAKLKLNNTTMFVVRRWCDRCQDAHDGALVVSDDAAWWTCSSCDHEVDVTDEVRGAFRDI